MNRIYRTVWNPTLRAHVAAPETARSRSKRGGQPAVLTCAAMLVASAAWLPTGASAQAVWQQPNAGNWTAPGNWSAGVPDATTQAVIDNGGTAQVTTLGAQAADVTVGPTLPGVLSISGGGTLTLVGQVSPAARASANILNGSLIIQDAGSRLNGSVLLGSGASLTVQNGGTIFEANGGSSFSSGSTTLIQGAGTSVDLGSGGLTAGGNLTVRNGAVLASGSTVDIDQAIVDGPGSQWNMGALEWVGTGGGLLTVRNGGFVSSANATIGFGRFGQTGTATLLVDGPGSTFSAPIVLIGAEDANGIVTLQNGGLLSSDAILMRPNANVTSTLNVGSGGLAGILDAPSVDAPGTGGVATVNFNHTDDITVRAAFSGDLNINKRGAGATQLTGASTYSGPTSVEGGTWRAGAASVFSPNSAYTVSPGATLDMAGFSQTVSSLNNSGTVSTVGSAPGATLTVTGPYVGNNGVLRLGTRLGDSSSVSDRLVLDGPGASASGSTTLQITNLGGLGAATTGSGIEVISARNGATTTAQTDKSAFRLAGGTVAGAFEYRLYAADINGAGENWYLSTDVRSTGTGPGVVPVGGAPGIPSVPVVAYRAEVPLFAALPEQLRQANLAMLGNMHQRIGDDGVAAGSGTSPVQGMRQAWGRVITVDRDIRQSGTVSPSSQGRLNGFQVGTDLFATPNFKAGIYVGQLDGDMQVSGFASGLQNYAVGSNDLRSQYLGAYATWKNDSGLYLDGVVQGGRHRTSVNPAASFESSGKGSSLLASIEAGQAFQIAPNWTIEPQLQLVHQRLSLDDANIVGARVQQDSHNGWTLRAGVRVKGRIDTGAGLLQPYARVNVYKRSSGTDITRFVGPAAFTDIATGSGGTSSELAAGATWQVSQSTSIYGEVGKLWASGGSARTKSGINGSLGVKVRW